jgi:hypothetical protein
MSHTTGRKPSARMWRAVAGQALILVSVTILMLVVVGWASGGHRVGCLARWLGLPC